MTQGTISCRRCGGVTLNAQGNCAKCGTPVWPVKPREPSDTV